MFVKIGMASSNEIWTESLSLRFQSRHCINSNDTGDDIGHFQLSPTLTHPWKTINELCSFEIIDLPLSKISEDSIKSHLLYNLFKKYFVEFKQSNQMCTQGGVLF